MAYTDKTCKEFIESVASKEPIPGGGSVAALVGALGASLSAMVARLTVGKKKYIAVAAEMEKNIDEITKIQKDLITLVQKDIDNFEPLAKLYKKKAKTPEEKAELDAEKHWLRNSRSKATRSSSLTRRPAQFSARRRCRQRVSISISIRT